MEMGAAQKGEVVGAGLTAGLDVRRFSADTERDREKALNAVKHAAPLSVKLMGANPVDRSSNSFLSDIVVAKCGLHRIVSHQVPQDIWGNARVGMTLCEAVPVGVRNNGARIEVLLALDSVCTTYSS